MKYVFTYLIPVYNIVYRPSKCINISYYNIPMGTYTNCSPTTRRFSRNRFHILS